MRLKKCKKEKEFGFVLQYDTNKGNLKKAAQKGILYQVLPSNSMEARELSQLRETGKILALWKAGWDIAQIASEILDNPAKVALVIASAELYPEFFVKKEKKEVPEEEEDCPWN